MFNVTRWRMMSRGSFFLLQVLQYFRLGLPLPPLAVSHCVMEVCTRVWPLAQKVVCLRETSLSRLAVSS